MQPTLDDFRSHIPEETLARFGSLVQLFPKRTWDRTALSQFGMAVVGAAAAVVCLVVSLQVVVSNKPEEQLPFQQAMWGLAAVAGILALYGICTGISRALVGISGVGKWWLLLERGLVILSSGKVQQAIPLDELKVKTGSQIASQWKLLDAAERALPLPPFGEVPLVDAVIAQQNEFRSRAAATTPAVPAPPHVLAWMEGKWFFEDRTYRLYPDGKQVLLIFAGQFEPEQFGIDSTTVLPVVIGIAARAAKAIRERLAGKRIEKQIDKRAAYLDALSLDQLRAEARRNDASRILTPEMTNKIRFGPATATNWSNDALVERATARLFFIHQQNAWALHFFHTWDLEIFRELDLDYFWTWQLTFFTPQDRDFAREVFCQAFGDTGVQP
jgi:hypothetical protein